MGPAPGRGGGADRGVGAAGGRGVHLLVPARGATGKRRLLAPPGVDHAALARAMALDTVAAALACPAVARVLVVSGDPALAAALPPAAGMLRDRGGGLAAAVAAGLRALTAPSTYDDLVGVLLGDLPAVTARELGEALAAAEGVAGPSFVPDHRGEGTVLLVGPAGALRPAFGSGSASRHAAHARRLDLPLARLRRDVDDAVDLAAALALGVGPHTRAALAGATPSARRAGLGEECRPPRDA